MIVPVYCTVLLALFAFNQVQSYPFGNNDQWSNPRVGMTGYHQQQNGYNGGGQLDNNFGHGGWGDGHRGGRQGNNFGQGGWGNGYSQNRGGQQESAQAYKSQVFNEPDRYGYDYTIPGATVHYLMYKKQGNRGSGSYGQNDNGWNKRY